jgi:hypothetical protein
MPIVVLETAGTGKYDLQIVLSLETPKNSFREYSKNSRMKE